MAKKTALETTEEQLQVQETPIIEETTKEVDPKLVGYPSRDFTIPINEG